MYVDNVFMQKYAHICYQVIFVIFSSEITPTLSITCQVIFLVRSAALKTASHPFQNKRDKDKTSVLLSSTVVHKVLVKLLVPVE